MLCASVLAELEAIVPVEESTIPPRGDDASTGSSSTADSDQGTPLSLPSSGLGASVGAPRDFSGLASGTTSAYDSLEKWILAALRKLDKEKFYLLWSPTTHSARRFTP